MPVFPRVSPNIFPALFKVVALALRIFDLFGIDFCRR
jgi:hypothetical protein